MSSLFLSAGPRGGEPIRNRDEYATRNKLLWSYRKQENGTEQG